MADPKTFTAFRLRRKSLRNPDDGWTFVETLIVLGIILLLTASVGFMAIRYFAKAQTVAARSQIETLATALQAYFLDCGAFPSQEQGLEALYAKPTREPVPERWFGPYIAKAVPKDPWGREYVYSVPGPDGMPFGISSLGRDGAAGGEGENADIVSW